MDFKVEYSRADFRGRRIELRAGDDAVGEAFIIAQGHHYIIAGHSIAVTESCRDMAEQQRRVLPELLRQAAELARADGAASISFITGGVYPVELLEGAGFEKEIDRYVWAREFRAF